MRIADLLLPRPKPTRLAAVYPSRESAVAAAEAAKIEGHTDDAQIRVVGPLERLIGNEPQPTVRGAWAVIVQPNSYPQCKRIVRALRRSLRRRADERARREPAAA